MRYDAMDGGPPSNGRAKRASLVWRIWRWSGTFRGSGGVCRLVPILFTIVCMLY